MNDDQIAEYLRARGRIDPPLDFVGAVAGAVAYAPQRRASWFAPLIPAAAAVGAAAAVTVLAILVSKGPNVGPPPAPSTSVSERAAPTGTPSPPASASPTPRPTPMPTPTHDADLLEAGNTVRVHVMSGDGVTGTITLERGADVGGYPLVTEPSSESHFFVEVFATYELESATEEGQWGALDWRVASADGTVDGQLVDSFPPPKGRGPLGQWPGATVPDTRYEGWMIFAIAREAAATSFDLV